MRHSAKDLQSIFRECEKARDRAYCPNSKHPVGCVVIDDQGYSYAGCNVEAAHFKGICAEGTAITQMVLNGGRKIKDVFVIGPSDALCTPCGDCRQRIREFADGDTRIHCFTGSAEDLKSFTMDELLPHSFGPEALPQNRTDKKQQ